MPGDEGKAATGRVPVKLAHELGRLDRPAARAHRATDEARVHVHAHNSAVATGSGGADQDEQPLELLVRRVIP